MMFTLHLSSKLNFFKKFHMNAFSSFFSYIGMNKVKFSILTKACNDFFLHSSNFGNS